MQGGRVDSSMSQQPGAVRHSDTTNLPPSQQTVSSQLWNLDRIDQRDLPLDGTFTYGTATSAGTGRGATIYVVDSGVRLSHQEFKTQDGTRSRASYGGRWLLPGLHATLRRALTSPSGWCHLLTFCRWLSLPQATILWRMTRWLTTAMATVSRPAAARLLVDVGAISCGWCDT